jgi:hypothetical protein
MASRQKKAKLIRLSPEDEEKLIGLVQERPYLYNKENMNYKNKDMKINAWTEIARSFDMSG